MRDPLYLRKDIKDTVLTATHLAKDGERIVIPVETNAGVQNVSWTMSTQDIFAWRAALVDLPPECWDNRRLSRQAVYRAIDEERDYQDQKWGINKEQSVPGFLLVLRKELEEAEDGWMKSTSQGRHSVLAEITQIAATAVACLEKYGTDGLPNSTNDIP